MTVSSNEHDSYVEVRVLFDCKIFSRVWQLVSIKHCTMWARNLHDEWSKDSQGRSDKEREENKTRPDGGPGLHSQLWLLQKMETRDRINNTFSQVLAQVGLKSSGPGPEPEQKK